MILLITRSKENCNSVVNRGMDVVTVLSQVQGKKIVTVLSKGAKDDVTDLSQAAKKIEPVLSKGAKYVVTV